MKKKALFNINEYVWVKLTPHGKNIFYKHYSVIYDQLKNLDLPTLELPESDEQGFRKFQMWDLMNIYGNYMVMGSENPFNLEIYFEIDEEL